MRYESELEKKIKKHYEEICEINKKITIEREIFLNSLIAKGWQKFEFYSNYYDSKQIYYFAPEVKIPEFKDFEPLGEEDDKFDEFINNLKNDQIYS